MFKGNEKFIDQPLRLFDFFNTRKRKWLLPILYLIYKLILKGILILGSRKSSRCQTTLQNSQIPLVGLAGTFACYHALTRAERTIISCCAPWIPFSNNQLNFWSFCLTSFRATHSKLAADGEV